MTDTCPMCRHAAHDHLGFCPNLASDNECNCKGFVADAGLQELADRAGLDQEQVEKMTEILTEAVNSYRENSRGDFPDHQHAWEIVEIGNMPIAVTCQICDMSKAVELRAPEPAPRQQVDVSPGKTVMLTQGGMQLPYMQVESVDVSSSFGSHSTVTVHFTTPDLPF